MAARRRRRKRGERGGAGPILLLAVGLALAIRFSTAGPLFELRETLEAALARHFDFKSAAEALGRAVTPGEGEHDNAVLVFGRMILGLDEEEETAVAAVTPEKAEGFAADACGLADSPLPVMRLGFFRSAAPDLDEPDDTPNEAFRIPSPDVVDDAPYELTFPAALPLAAYRVTSRFGYRVHPVSGNTTFHYGVDLAAAAGTRVASVADGTVEETGCGQVNGNYVRVSHADGFATMYAHLQSISVRQGQKVELGQQIGTVGSTGLSTGPHLHFELRRGGRLVDPMKAFAL